MDFSLKSSASCFSSQCGLCYSCCGEIGGPTGRVKNNYYYPGYVDEKPLYEEDNKYTNWSKYQDMLKVAQESLEKVKGAYKETETPALTSELFAMREMGIPLEGSIRVQQGYLFRADHFNRMDKLSSEEFQGYVDKFPEFQEKMANLVKKYNYYYPEKPGTIPKFVDTENGRYTLIEKTGGQMCDDPECTMIGHCVIEDEERNSVDDPDGFLFNGMSEYYKTLPIYTKNKNHELCALCLLK
tara:strand:+ start:5611 stop:6333 length:723 start_codon:yes stop_codon:yes gene_type:complete